MEGPTAGASPMTLLRSAPRPAYRMYSEEEFLAAEDWQVETESEFALVGQASPRRRESKRWGALAALAALPCVIAAVVGVVALNATRTKPQSSRRVAARGGSPPETAADRPSVGWLGASLHKPTRRVSGLVGRITGHELRPVDRLPITAHPHRPPPPTPPSATASAPTAVAPAATLATPSTTAPASTAPTSTAPTAAAPTAAEPTTVTPATPAAATASTPVAATTETTTPPAAGEADAEFGFERR